jgi:hypothetical protein
MDSSSLYVFQSTALDVSTGNGGSTDQIFLNLPHQLREADSMSSSEAADLVNFYGLILSDLFSMDSFSMALRFDLRGSVSCRVISWLHLLWFMDLPRAFAAKYRSQFVLSISDYS